MLRVTALTVCLALVLGGPAVALGAPNLEPAFGNTIVSVHPDGRRAKLRINRDHTYWAMSRAGKQSGGVWALKGEKICLSQKSPFPGPFSVCKDLPSIRVGDKWADKAINGEPVTNMLLPGQG
jgi:hypothetical protein